MMVSDYSVNRIARITGGNFLPMDWQILFGWKIRCDLGLV